MYQVLLNSKTTLPPEALAIVRYHSCYALHRDNGYDHFLKESDRPILEWVKLFNNFDLYTKEDELIDIENVLPYYEIIFGKYFPNGKLFF